MGTRRDHPAKEDTHDGRSGHGRGVMPSVRQDVGQDDYGCGKVDDDVRSS